MYSGHCKLPQGLHLGWSVLLRKRSNRSSGVYYDEDCVTHIKLKWRDSILLNGDCVVEAPECLDGTDYKVKNCVSFNILECRVVRLVGIYQTPTERFTSYAVDHELERMGQRMQSRRYVYCRHRVGRHFSLYAIRYTSPGFTDAWMNRVRDKINLHIGNVLDAYQARVYSCSLSSYASMYFI